MKMIFPLIFLLMLVPFEVLAVESYDVKIGLIIPYRKLIRTIDFGTSASAITMAIKRIQQEKLLEGAKFNVTWLFTDCNEMLSMKASANMYLEQEVDVIIGPSCSIAAVVTGILGGAYNLPLVTWAATDPDLNVEVRFPTLISSVGTMDSLGFAITEVLDFFKWAKIAMMYSDDGKERKCHYVKQGIEERIHMKHGNTTTAFLLKAKGVRATQEEMDYFLNIISNRARIAIVCLDLMEDRRQFMLKVREKGMDNDEYVYILPDYVGDENRTHPWVDYTQNNRDGKNMEAKKAFEKALIIEFAMSYTREVHEFKMEVPKLMKDWPFFYDNPLPEENYGSIYSPFMYDAVYLYGIALNKTLDAGLSKKDGKAVFDKSRNVQFQGMSGYVLIDEWSIRKPDFVLKGFDNTNTFTTLAKLLMDNEDGNIVSLWYPEWKLWANRQNGQRPLDHPRCGYKGEFCSKDSNLFVIQIAIGLSVGLLLLLVMLVSIGLYWRNARATRAMQATMWKISPAELTKLHLKERDSSALGSHSTFGSSNMSMSGSGIISLGQQFDSEHRLSGTLKSHNVYVFRGGLVLVRSHNITNAAVVTEKKETESFRKALGTIQKLRNAIKELFMKNVI